MMDCTGMLPREWRICIHCARVSLNPMTRVIIYMSVKRFGHRLGIVCYIEGANSYM